MARLTTDADVTAQLTSALVFTTWIVHRPDPSPAKLQNFKPLAVFYTHLFVTDPGTGFSSDLVILRNTEKLFD